MSDRVLITGGAGFIGSNLALKLVDKGYYVRVLDNLSKQIHGENAELPQKLVGKVEFIKGDVSNIDDLREALRGMDAVVHLAAETGTGQSMYEVYHYTDINIGGTAKLLDILVNESHNVQKVIVASSRAIYGEGKYLCDNDGIVYPEFRRAIDMEKGDYSVKCPICGKEVSVTATSEDSKLHPSSVYGITKQAQEELVLTLCDGLKISSLAYRFQNVYGPGQSLTNPYTGILSIFSTRILQGKDINIFEDGKESRDFIYIDDVTDALVAGIEAKQYINAAVNIGTGVMTSVSDVVKELMKCYNNIVYSNVTGMFRVGDIRHNYADVSLAKTLLGFEAKTDFESGIKLFADWVKQQEVSNNRYEESLEEMRKKGLLK